MYFIYILMPHEKLTNDKCIVLAVFGLSVVKVFY